MLAMLRPLAALVVAVALAACSSGSDESDLFSGTGSGAGGNSAGSGGTSAGASGSGISAGSGGSGGQGGASQGEEKGPCYPNGTCNEGLTCASGLCVNLGSGGSSGSSGSAGSGQGGVGGSPQGQGGSAGAPGGSGGASGSAGQQGGGMGGAGGGACVPLTKEQACAANQCGTASDGCGNQIACKTCPVWKQCTAGQSGVSTCEGGCEISMFPPKGFGCKDPYPQQIDCPETVPVDMDPSDHCTSNGKVEGYLLWCCPKAPLRPDDGDDHPSLSAQKGLRRVRPSCLNAVRERAVGARRVKPEKCCGGAATGGDHERRDFAPRDGRRASAVVSGEPELRTCGIV